MKRIFIYTQDSLLRLNIDDISHIQAQGDYVDVHTSKRKYTIHNSLQNMVSYLPKNFYRVHRSFIINLDRIEKIFGIALFLDNGIEVPISKDYKSELLSKLNIIKLK